MTGTFCSAHLKLNLAFVNAVLNVGFDSKLFDSANFWILLIWSLVVDLDNICDKIVGTSVSDSNLEMCKKKVESVQMEYFVFQIKHLHFGNFLVFRGDKVQH